MQVKTNYQKVASYEAKIGEINKIILLYSGGLDTSVILKWIQEKYKTDVITLTLDLGQQCDNLTVARKKAIKLKKAAQITAWVGVKIRVETAVAIEFAAS